MRVFKYFFLVTFFFQFASCNPFLEYAYFIEFSSLGWFFCDLCLVSLFCKFVSNSFSLKYFRLIFAWAEDLDFSLVHTKNLNPLLCLVRKKNGYCCLLVYNRNQGPISVSVVEPEIKTLIFSKFFKNLQFFLWFLISWANISFYNPDHQK